MNLKSNIVIELERNGKIYSFSMPVGAPFGEAYDCAFAVLQKVVELAKVAADATKNQQNPDSSTDQQAS